MSAPQRLFRRIVRALLALYPARFRREFGRDVADTHVDRYRSARRRGRAAALGYSVRALADVCWGAMLEWTDAGGGTWRLGAGRASAIPEAMMRIWRELQQDARYAVRMLARSPGFTLVALGSLALAIGATSAIFSVIHAVLLRPLPYGEPSTLVRIWETHPERSRRNVVSPGNYHDWAERATSFAAIGAHSHSFGMTLTGLGDPATIRLTRLTPSALALLDAQPVTGRPFADGDGVAGAPDVVILSHAFWRQRLGADPGAIGRSLTLDDRPYTVVGVMPPSFAFPAPPIDAWLPQRFGASSRDERRGHNLHVIGRLRPEVTRQAAQAEMSALAAAIAQEHPEFMTGWGVNVVAFRDDLVGDVRPLVLVLFAIVAAVLLIACANLASLLLARGAARRHEMAVRSAIGAGRGRLVRQLLVETLMLSLGGALAGVGAVWLGFDALLAFAPGDMPLLHDVRIDRAVLGFAIGQTVAVTLLTGAVPALRTAGVDLRASLAGAAPAQDPRHTRGRQALVTAQVALAFMLLVGAALLVRSFANLQAVEHGFDPRDALVVMLDLPRSRYPDREAQTAFYERLLERLRALPGVTAAGGTAEPPVVGFQMTFSFAIEGRPSRDPSGLEEDIYLRAVTYGFFEASGIPLLSGRSLHPTDRAGGPPVVVINRAMAVRHWPDGDPVGRRISFRGPEGPWYEIVGVAGDTRDLGLDRASPPAVYLPFAQKPDNWGWMSWHSLVIRPAGDIDPLALVPAVREIVLAADDRLPLQEVTTLRALYADSAARRRFAMQLLAACAGIALLIGTMGIYGVVSYAVARRRREIGIRMALGARPADVGVMVVRGALALAATGVTIGLLGAAGASRFIESLLFGIAPNDLPTYGAIAALLLAVAALAAWVPARRAMRVDPAVALRTE